MKMEKKLIIFIPSIESGGVEKNLFIISNHLIKKFKIIYLITTDYKYKNKFNKKIKLIVPKSKFWINKKRIYKYFICSLLLLKIIFKEKNFLIFSFQANLYAIIIAKIFFKKVIIRVNSSPSGWVNNYFKLLIYKIFYNLSDEIITNSKELQNEFFEYFRIKTKIIYNPLNISTIQKSIKNKFNFTFFKKNHLNLITIGRFVSQKNHLLILKAVKILKDKLPIRLLIIGQGALLNEYKRFISKNNFE